MTVMAARTPDAGPEPVVRTKTAAAPQMPAGALLTLAHGPPNSFLPESISSGAHIVGALGALPRRPAA